MSDAPTLTYPITDPQTVLNHVWHHFVTLANPRCTLNTGCCTYRGSGCAVGCLIPKATRAHWDRAIHGSTAIATVHMYRPKSFSRYFDDDLIDMLTCFQDIHDGWGDEVDGHFPTYMANALTHYAIAHDLVVPS